MSKHEFRLAIFNTQPPHLYFGGVERRILETTKRLENQADITIYSGTKAGFKETTTINGIKFVPSFSTDTAFPLDNWLFNRSIVKKTPKIKADIYETHAVSGYGVAEKLCKLGVDKPFIHVIHGVLADEYEQAKKNRSISVRGRIANYLMKYLSKLEKETAKKASTIVTISNYSKEKILEKYDIDSSKIIIIPNGVDTEKFKPILDIKAARQQFGLGEERYVLYVGSLIPRKGLSHLIKAAKQTIADQPETVFIIVGEGPLRSKLEGTIKAANMQRNFKFIGNINEAQLPTLYSCTDVFVLPSIQEGQGIVLLEAQAAGKPVVAFNIGGVNETVKNQETGLLIETGNTEALANGLLRLLSDDELRTKMGANGRQFVAKNFTWNICAQKMLDLYQHELNK